jgi:hypothetical protein
MFDVGKTKQKSKLKLKIVAVQCVFEKYRISL